jgi:hypothetical protein
VWLLCEYGTYMKVETLQQVQDCYLRTEAQVILRKWLPGWDTNTAADAASNVGARVRRVSPHDELPSTFESKSTISADAVPLMYQFYVQHRPVVPSDPDNPIDLINGTYIIDALNKVRPAPPPPCPWQPTPLSNRIDLIEGPFIIGAVHMLPLPLAPP